MVKLGFKATEKSYVMPRDTREGLSLAEKRVRDMYDVDYEITPNAAATALGISWATAKKYLDATKEARGISE
jgi:response regulator of citrate/malate metabolism